MHSKIPHPKHARDQDEDRVESEMRLIAVAVLSLIVLQATSQVSVLNIPIGRSWPRSIVTNPNTHEVFVDATSGIYPSTVGFSFEVVNSTSETLISTVPLPGMPGEMAIDTARNLVYVLSSDKVLVYDGAVGNFTRTFTVGAPGYDIAFDASLGMLLITTQVGLVAVNATSGSVISTIPLGSFPEGIAIDPSSQLVYVANYLSASVSVVSASNLALVKTIQLPKSSYPAQLVLDTSTGVLYSTTDENYIVAIQTGDGAERSIQVTHSNSNGTFAMALDQSDDLLYVAVNPGTVVAKVDGSSGSLASTIKLEYGAYEMAVDQASGKLYVTDYHQLTVVTPTGGSGYRLYLLASTVALVLVAVAGLGLVSSRKRR